MVRFFLAALAVMSIFATTPAEARRSDAGWWVFPAFSDAQVRVQKRKWYKPRAHRASQHRHSTRKSARQTRKPTREARAYLPGSATRILAHPTGCPRTLFCGCGLSVHFFQKAVRAGGLAVAAEWGRRFQRAALAAGTAVVTRGGSHVYGVLAVLGPRIVLAWDANSGSHLTRIHQRRIRVGDVIVNPRARRI